MPQRPSNKPKRPRFDPLNEALQAIPPAMRQQMWLALPVEMQHNARRVEALLTHSRAGTLATDRHQALMKMARRERSKPKPLSPYKLADAVLGALPAPDGNGDHRVEVVPGKRVIRVGALRSLATSYGEQREALLAEVDAIEAARQTGETVAEQLLASPEGRAFDEQAGRRVRALPPGAAVRMRKVPAATPSPEGIRVVAEGIRQALRKSEKPTG